MLLASWNPWHGCHRISEGCRHCYVFRMDSHYGRISDAVHKNRDFDLPVRKNRDGSYKIPSGEEVYTCFTSDFFLEDADPWREAAWQMIAQRQDLHFLMITKRIHRFDQCVPPDWGKGYPNVTICCTIENQDQADFRLPFLPRGTDLPQAAGLFPSVGADRFVPLSGGLGGSAYGRGRIWKRSAVMPL